MREKFALSLITNLSGNALLLISSYLLVLNFNTYQLGIWVLSNTIINLGFLFIDIGLDQIHYQYSAKKDFVDYFGTFFALKTLIIGINVAVSFILSFILILSFPESGTINLLLYIIILILDKVIFSFTNIFLINLKSKIKVFKAEIPTFFHVIGKSSMILYISLNLTHLINPIFDLCISFLTFDIFYFIFTFYISKSEFHLKKPKKEHILSYLRDIKPLFFFSIILIISSNLGNLILVYNFGHEILAYFGLVNAYIIPVLLLMSGSFITIYLPLFSQNLESNKLSHINEISTVIEKYLSIIYLIFILIFLLNGDLIFIIFLPRYIDSLPILQIMIFIPYLYGVSRHYPYLLIAGKKQKVAANIHILNYTLIIILMLILTPKSFFIFPTFGWGMLGCAIAQTLPWILWTFLIRYYTFKFIKIKFRKKLCLHIPIFLITLILGFLIKKYIFEMIFHNLFIILIISLLITIGIFLFFLFLLKELKKEDLTFFLDLLQFKSYKKSFKQEFSN